LQRRLKNLVVIEFNYFSQPVFPCSFAALFRFALFLFAALFFAGQTNADRLFRQVHDVADGRLDGKVASQILLIVFALAGDSTMTNERAI